MTSRSKRPTRTRETFVQAERNRARVLAFLKDRPGAVLADIMAHMRMTRERAAQLVLRMERLGEITRTEGGVSPHGGRPCAKHFAAVERTVTAAEVFAHLKGNLNGERKGRKIVRFEPRRPLLPAPRLFGGL